MRSTAIAWKRSPEPRTSDLNRISFIDLVAQRQRLGSRLHEAMDNVLAHGQYIMGPEVDQLESRLTQFCDVPYAITCASGTDALLLVLMARGVGPGDAVLVPAFTFAATAEVVALLGASPVFVDVSEGTWTLDPESVLQGIAVARRAGLRPVGTIAVDLFGQPADYEVLRDTAGAHDLWLLADAAQSLGATSQGRRVGTLADCTATSFFPSKPLGCYGDGGAVFTTDAGLAESVRSLRLHGAGKDKYDNRVVGLNSRLDTLQAAVLLAKLRLFDWEMEQRQRAADRYARLLPDGVTRQTLADGVTSSWALYTIAVEDRDEVRSELLKAGIPTAVYYPKPLHQQRAYERFPVAGHDDGGLPVSEWLAGHVLSLPMHPYLSEGQQEHIVGTLEKSIEHA